jgi:hypothetical protein
MAIEMAEELRILELEQGPHTVVAVAADNTLELLLTNHFEQELLVAVDK